MKDRLAEVVDEVVITGQNTEEKMCSCESDVVDETCSSECYDACGNRLLAHEETLSLRGLAGFFCKYVPVFLEGKMNIKQI